MSKTWPEFTPLPPTPDPILWQPRIRIEGTAGAVRRMDPWLYLDVSVGRLLALEIRIISAAENPTLSIETQVTKDYEGSWQLLEDMTSMATNQNFTKVYRVFAASGAVPLKWLRWSATATNAWHLDFVISSFLRDA